MRELANNRVSEEILKTLWLQRLPANVQGILSVSADPNLATLAILADKILEVCDPRNSVCVVNNELPISNRSRSPNADIADRIEALTRRFDEFESRYSSRLPRPRDRSRTRSKSPRRLSRSARQKVDDGSWLCRYHFRFAPHTPTNTNTSNRENSTQEPTLIPSDERPDTRATTQDARTDLPDVTPPRSRHPRVDPPDPTRERRTRSGRV
ncbi:unnamed protein product, partial [Nesidiocoris tenuis]